LNLFIYCYGGLGREVYDIAFRFNHINHKWRNIFFIEDDVRKIDKNNNIYSFEAVKKKFNNQKIEIIIGNGEPKIRKKIFDKVISEKLKFGTLIDPTAVVSSSAQIENGVIIAPLCSIQSNSIIRENVLINTGSIVGHDIEVGESSVISSLVNVGGSCKIGKKVFLGMGCAIKENLTIGSNTIIGMGSYVHKSIGEKLIAMGNPAREIRKNDKEEVFKKV
jgi:sugar O-acyltransferase (sialic acid O-acetyltransferase NeuD family)